MTASLFESESSSAAPLAVRMRPRTLAEFVGQHHALTQGSPLRRLLDTDSTQARTSVILWGPPGTGKTTLAQLMARAGEAKFVELSAITAGIKDVRDVISAAQDNKSMFGVQTVLFVDEVHRFNKTQQDALLPGVENGWVTLVAATTENPSFSVISPLLSRSLLITLHSLNNDDISALLDRALTEERGLNSKVTLDDKARDMIIRLAGGDARRALTVLEASAAVAAESETPVVTEEHVSLASDHNVVRYDKSGDQHYDVISAFIKSVRGSDVDAALHYLARMIEAGEDPRFIARRLLILASEDIGLADNSMLTLASSAMQTVSFIGMPEARITLAHVTTAMCLAPKSNSAYVAIDRAIADVRSQDIGQVPPHLRDSHYQRAGSLGHGVGYIYPHDLEEGVASQQYLPDSLAEAVYYQPAPRGAEVANGNVWSKIRSLLGRK